MMRFRNRAAAAAGAATVAAALLLSACSSDGSANDDANATSSGVDAEAAVAASAAKVAEFSSADQEFPAPPGAFDPGTHKAAVIALGFTAPAVQDNAQHSVDALKSMGWEVDGPFDGKFNPTEIGGLLDSAVQNGAEAVICVSCDPESFAQSVKAALGEGVAMACVMCVPNAEYTDLGMHYATIDFEHQGEVLGWYAINQSKGVGKVVTTLDPGIASTAQRAKGVSAVVTNNCDTCELLDELVVPAASLAKPGPPEWTAYLNAHPEGDVTTAVAMADVLGTLMAKSQKDAGRSDISIMGYDALEEAVNLIKSGDLNYAGTVALPYTYADYAAADLVARDLAGEETWDASNLPVQLITPDNAADFTGDFAPAGDWQAELASLWGVK